MIFDSDLIDDACMQMSGHTNWAYFDMLSDKDKKKALKDGIVVAFYREPAEAEG